MKKLLCMMLFLTISIFSYAQKGSVSKAKSYKTKGDYINAKAEIDMAITIEKTAGKAATWYERGEIYKAIMTSEDEATRAIDVDAFEKALEAYKKVLSMEKENAINAVFSNEKIEQLWGFHLNKGGDFYEAEDYAGAYGSFVEALKVKPEDSLTLLYAGIASQLGEMYDKTLIHYNKMIDMNMAGKDSYSTVIYIERAINKDDEKALEVIQKAKTAYPSETSFNQEEIAILINLNKLDQAKDKIKSEIERDPTNANLYLNLAVMHDNIGSKMAGEGKTEEANTNYAIAKENYQKAVELDPESYIGNFNLGAIHVNSAKVYYDEVNNMDLKTYDKKGPAVIEKADGILKQGLPFMIKATELKPEDVDALSALQQMYTQLKMLDEAEAILNKIDELNAAGN